MSSSQRRWSHLCMLIALLASFSIVRDPTSAQTGTMFTVTTTDYLTTTNLSCNTPCSLYQAIEAANNAGASASNPVTIKFAIPADPGNPAYDESDLSAITWTITPETEALPAVESYITIDGNSQAEHIGGQPNQSGPEIIIDGTQISTAGGITIVGDNSVVKGLGIVGFQGGKAGIQIDGDNNTILGNYIGVNKYGDTPDPNTGPGIWLTTSAEGNTIGGNSSRADEANVISGNLEEGIFLQGDGNFIKGNFIGTDRFGSAAVPNQLYGIYVFTNANNNIIGTDAAGSVASERNLISGNGRYGIYIADSSNNEVYGNRIGTNNTTTSRIPNGEGGILIGANILNTQGNKIGGPGANARNYIVGNNGPGIAISGRRASNNIITNNYIGLNQSGQLIGGTNSQTVGVLIENGANNNRIGGGTQTERNVISGINGDGIRVAGLLTANSDLRSNTNTIAGNYIGTDTTGTAAIPNAGDGIEITTNITGTIIGGTSPEARNIIAYNGGHGININASSSGVFSTTIQKNDIQFNTGYGINLANADITLIDGVDSTNPLEVVENGIDGIFLDNATNTTIRNSLIQENAANGIQVTGSVSATIEFNEVFTNTLDGVLVGSDSQGIALLNNRMTGNGELGIDLDPDTPAPGSASNPNHDIDPPFDLRINQNGLVSGLVLTDTQQAAACLTCLIQVFTTNPETRDGQGLDFVVAAEANPDGSFSAELGFAPEDATQLALTATDVDADEQRNTSEFVTFEITRSVVIEPPRTTIDAIPTQVITYFHTVTNTGTVEDEFVLSGESSLGLDFGIEPAEAFTLEAGETQEVTVTLTLPIGSDERVRAGNTDLLTITVTSTSDDTVTDSVVDTTSIAGKIVITVDPAASNGLTRAGERLDYSHTIRNVGNIAATLDLALDLSETPPNWTTSLSGNTFTLGPGQSAQPVLSVTPPAAALAGLSATTYISVTVREDATENKIITDTTTVTTTAAVFIVPSSITFDGAAGKVTTFQHTITNISNGPVTLQLRGTTSLGSQVSFQAISSDIQFGPDNTVTIPVEDGRNVFTFQANVLIPESAGRGQEDVLTLQVIDASTGNIIASVQDITRVVIGRVKLWLPIAGRTT